MALTQVGYSDYGINGSTSGISAAVPVPASLVTNDIAIVIGKVEAAAYLDTITPPAGFSVIPNTALANTFVDTSGDYWQVAAFAKYISGDSGTWTFSWTHTTPTMWFCDVIRGAPVYVSVLTAIDVALTRHTIYAGAGTPTQPVTWSSGGNPTTAENGELVVLGLFNDNGTSHEAAGVPTGWTLRSAAGAVFGGDLLDETFASAGAIGAVTEGTWVVADHTATFVAVKSITSCTVNPSISGSTVQGQVLTATTGTWSGGGGSFAYQWKSAGSNVGTNASTYTTVLGDVGNTITCVVTASNIGGSATGTSAATATITSAGGSAPTNAGGANLPAITGTAKVNNLLTASTGTWTNSPTGYTYQWAAGGVAITGATNSTYTPAVTDFGLTITVAVTATNAHGSSSPATSAATAAIAAGGTAALPIVGELLTLTNCSWNGSPTFAYSWQRCDTTGANPVTIGGQTALTYTVQTADIGSTVRGVVTATNAAGVVSQASAPTGVVVGPPVNTVAPTVTGNPQQTQVLTASTGTWSGGASGGGLLYAYQWQRDGSSNIGGATTGTYTVAAGDVGHTLNVVVTATNAAGQTSQASTATASVAGTSSPWTISLNVPTNTITWAAQPGATGYQGAISNVADGQPGRVTSYVNLGNVLTWTPAASPGQTLYYGVEPNPPTGPWSIEVAITWAASTSKLRVSVNNSTGFGLDAMFANVGVTRTRLGTQAQSVSIMQQAVNDGMKPLCMLEGGSGGSLAGISPADAASGALSLARTIYPWGVREMEFGNEVYLFQGGAAYSAQYHAAKVAIGSDSSLAGFKLIAAATSSYYSSRTGGSGNWFTDMKNGLIAAGGSVGEVDGWTLHPYPPGLVSDPGLTGTSSDGYGWPLIQTLHDAALAAGFSNVGWWLTELGCNFSNEASQASYLTATLNDILANKSYVALWNWYAAKDNTFNCGIVRDDNTPRQAFTALGSWMAAHTANTDG